MTTLKHMKEQTETHKFTCDFCGASFIREQSMIKHACESKRRFQDKEKHANRIGFHCWEQFYRKNTNAKKQKTYLDFVKSAYYTAFVRFGNYCADINAINIPRYMDWLLENQIKIDAWTSDQVYTRYLIYYLKEEDAMDAIARSIETTIKLAEQANIKAGDYLLYGNKNRICHVITNGRISPWMLYQSNSGIEFIDSLDETQQSLIYDYVNPEQWALKFSRNAEQAKQVKELLKEAGY